MEFGKNLKPKQASIEATIVRADGTTEPLGTIDYYHRSPLMRLAWRLLRRFGWRGRFWK